MAIIDWNLKYRRDLKRKNYSPHTVKTYMNAIKLFVLWVDVPLEEVRHEKIGQYIDSLMYKRLKAKTVNCHLAIIRLFYDYLIRREGLKIPNPVKKGNCQRLPQPLPKHLREEEIDVLFGSIKNHRDLAMFKLMLRCGLRVEEVAHLTMKALDLKRRKVFIYNGKGGKGRVVYLSNDAYQALVQYLKVRSCSKVKKVWLVEKGTFKGKPISVRGIQKRIEYYSRKTGVKVSCHQLRHTMATQLLNADADIVTIQDLLGHSRITTTQRYCQVSNLKAQRDYHKAMEVVMQRTARDPTRL
jgi:site-specific recombinase XerD